MRKPIHIEAAGKQSPRERVWSAIRSFKGKEFSRYDLARKAKVDDETVRTYVKSLELAGFIEVTKKPQLRKNSPVPVSGSEMLYKLVKDVGIEAPRLKKDGSPVTQGLGREQMWRTMKIVKQFTSTELAVQASTEEHQIKENEAADYIKYLTKAGYLHCMKECDKVNGGKAVYAFVRSKNTGPKPPMIQRVKQVYDPNLGKIVYAPDPSEVDQ